MIFDNIRKRVREDNSQPATLHQFASFLSAGNDSDVEADDFREEWEAIDYYQHLDIILQEMRTKGIITGYNAVAKNDVEERTNETEYSNEAIITLRHRSSKEHTDEQLVSQWGLEHEVPEAFTLDSWKRVQKTFNNLKELFGPGDSPYLPESNLPAGNVVPIYEKGTQEVAKDKKATPTELFPSREEGTQQE